MNTVAAIAGLLALPILSLADEVVLKDGHSIEFRIYKDNGDTVELQTLDAKTQTISKKDIKEVRVSVFKAPLTGATFTGDVTKAGGVTNLLTLIKPKEHGVAGEWKFVGGALSGKNGILETPYVPPAAYDIEIIAERREGESDLCIGMVASGKPFSMQFDCGKGAWSGLSAVDGRRSYENDTRTNGRVLVARKPVKIVCAVRTDGIVILVDGKEHLRWSGDPKRLSQSDRPEKDQNLFITILESTFLISRYTVTTRN